MHEHPKRSVPVIEKFKVVMELLKTRTHVLKKHIGAAKILLDHIIKLVERLPAERTKKRGDQGYPCKASWMMLMSCILDW
jgi:hypothetical protein